MANKVDSIDCASYATTAVGYTSYVAGAALLTATLAQVAFARRAIPVAKTLKLVAAKMLSLNFLPTALKTSAIATNALFILIAATIAVAFFVLGNHFVPLSTEKKQPQSGSGGSGGSV